jgi:acyl-CoA thioester hydrolase
MTAGQVVRVPVYRRFSDLDVLGHVNNVVFHDYLQEARVGMLRDLSLVHTGEYSQVVAEQTVRHRKPLLLAPEPVVIETWITRLGNSSYVIEYRIIDEHGDVAATATTVMAVVDATTGRPMRMPTGLREVLEPLVATEV